MPDRFRNDNAVCTFIIPVFHPFKECCGNDLSVRPFYGRRQIILFKKRLDLIPGFAVSCSICHDQHAKSDCFAVQNTIVCRSFNCLSGCMAQPHQTPVSETGRIIFNDMSLDLRALPDNVFQIIQIRTGRMIQKLIVQTAVFNNSIFHDLAHAAPDLVFRESRQHIDIRHNQFRLVNCSHDPLAFRKIQFGFSSDCRICHSEQC